LLIIQNDESKMPRVAYIASLGVSFTYSIIALTLLLLPPTA